jgi:prevent-host-death family protein
LTDDSEEYGRLRTSVHGGTIICAYYVERGIDMTTVAIEQAQENLSKLIDDVAVGEHVVITRNQVPIAELVPVSRPHVKPVYGGAKGMITMFDDFDAPLESAAG